MNMPLSIWIDINCRGTHCLAYSKYGSTISHFVDLPPPIELTEYFHKGTKFVHKIIYNYERQQNFNTE